MLDPVSWAGHVVVMGEVRPWWAKLPPAERKRRIAQSAADRARERGQAAATLVLQEPQRRRRQSQSAIDQSRAERWARPSGGGAAAPPDCPNPERNRYLAWTARRFGVPVYPTLDETVAGALGLLATAGRTGAGGTG
jgi:hypothetical protein